MQDSLGNTITTASVDALRQLDDAIDLHARAWPCALEAAQEATRLNPELALAHALQALIHAMWARPEAAGAAMQRAMELAGGLRSASAR